MIPTLILLYALNGAGTIPQGCFIAAWVLTSLEIVLKIIGLLIKISDKNIGNR